MREERDCASEGMLSGSTEVRSTSLSSSLPLSSATQPLLSVSGVPDTIYKDKSGKKTAADPTNVADFRNGLRALAQPISSPISASHNHASGSTTRPSPKSSANSASTMNAADLSVSPLRSFGKPTTSSSSRHPLHTAGVNLCTCVCRLRRAPYRSGLVIRSCLYIPSLLTRELLPAIMSFSSLPLDIVRLILASTTAPSLSRLAGTCRAIDALVIEELNFRYDALLLRYVADRPAFRALLGSTSSKIAGSSAALLSGLPYTFVPGDLDVYCDEYGLSILRDHLVTHERYEVISDHLHARHCPSPRAIQHAEQLIPVTVCIVLHHFIRVT